MRAVVIGNGDIKNYEYIKSKIHSGDFIICADGGCNHLSRLGIEADVVIGDFDSAECDNIKAIKIEYPTRKDYTDGELAVEYAVKHGFDNIVLIAMTGTRLDHTMSDIFLLAKCRSGVLIDDNNETYLLRDGLEITGRKGQTVSVVPVCGDAEGLVTDGLEYPLNDETIKFGASRGISNVMLSNECKITIKKGMALVIKVENV